MYEVLHQRRFSIEVIAGEKQYFLWYQLQQNKFIYSNYTWRRYSLLTSAVIMGVQMGWWFVLYMIYVPHLEADTGVWR
jgi:hypothetical protein